MDYAHHFHFFDEPSATKDAQNNNKGTNSGWLFDVSEFSALPGQGVQCFLSGKCVLVSVLYIEICKCQFISKICFITFGIAYRSKCVLNRLVIGS